MSNDTKHAVAASLFIIGMAMTPNSSLTTSLQYEYKPVSNISQEILCTSKTLQRNFCGNLVSSYTSSDPDNTSWTKKLYDVDGVATGEALLILFENIENLMEKHDYMSCNHILENIQYEKIRPEILVGLLRITSSNKSQIKSWNYAFDRASSVLSSAGFDTNIVLKGLDS